MKNRVNKKKSKASTIIKLFLGSVLLLIGAAFIFASVKFKFSEWHDLDPSLILECPQALRVYDKNGGLISVSGPEKRIWVSADSVPQHTLDAFVSAEDARFYTHEGIDIYRIFGAAWADIKAGGYVQGASTISQQLIKLSHLSSEKTMERKLEEAVLSIRLEKRFSKRQILEMYLNYIYFGGGYYGIETASLGYFGVHASELTIAQSAQLAGILKSPSAYSPHIDEKASLDRRNNVLKLMLEQGYINKEQYDSALNENNEIVNGLPSKYSDLVSYSINEALTLTGLTRDELLTGGYCIYTTADPEIEKECSALMNNDSLFPSENAQGAMVVIAPDGSIEAMTGGRGDRTAADIDRAYMIERQPGSLIKPVLVYAPALELYGYSAASLVEDEPKSFGDYTPRNSDDKYYGKVTLRTAVTKSLNIPAVSVLADIGIPSAVMFAEQLGISFEGEKLGLPLALGGFTHGVSPLEMAGAYNAFSNGGVYIKPISVNRITDRSGKTVYERAAFGRRVMREENAYILTSMLCSVASEGTGKRLSSLGFDIAAKTGTSVDNKGVRDAWCAAYTPEHTVVVWMGTDSAEKGSLPDDAVGGNQPAVMIAELFRYMYRDKKSAGFIKPEGVEEKDITVKEGEESGVYAAPEHAPEDSIKTEYFLPGDEPEETDPNFETPLPPDEYGWSMSERYKPVISFVANSSVLEYRLIRVDEEGGAVTAFVHSGEEGCVSFCDEEALSGNTYSYYFLTVNPALSDEKGGPLTSEPSDRIVITVP